MSSRRFEIALGRLTEAIAEVENAITALREHHDPLASHIFTSRREYGAVNDTKSGKRRELNARLSFNMAVELGFRGSLSEWERLLGAAPKR